VHAELGKNEHRPALPDEATKRFFGFLLGSKDYHNEGCSPHELKIKRKVRAFEDRSAFKARRGVFPGESRYHQAGAHDNAGYSSYDNDALVSLREQGDWLRWVRCQHSRGSKHQKRSLCIPRNATEIQNTAI
jgi:hypothetical protein